MMLTLMLTSKGVAAVPRASLVILSGALAQFGLPLEGVAVILGVDALMDMARTSINLVGNCLATVVDGAMGGRLRAVVGGHAGRRCTAWPAAERARGRHPAGRGVAGPARESRSARRLSLRRERRRARTPPLSCRLAFGIVVHGFSSAVLVVVPNEGAHVRVMSRSHAVRRALSCLSVLAGVLLAPQKVFGQG